MDTKYNSPGYNSIEHKVGEFDFYGENNRISEPEPRKKSGLVSTSLILLTAVALNGCAAFTYTNDEGETKLRKWVPYGLGAVAIGAASGGGGGSSDDGTPEEDPPEPPFP